MAKDPSYSSTPERSVEEDQGYLVPNWDQRGIMDEGYSIQQNYDEASKYVDSELQAFLQSISRISMSNISPGGTYAFGAGSLLTPGIRWADDSDSGLYLAAVGDMAAVIGGVAITNWTTSGFLIPSITATRVLYAGTGGLVSGDAGMTYDASLDSLTVLGSVGIGQAVTGATAVGVDGSEAIASAASAVWDGISFITSTATLTGSTNITTASGFNFFNINTPSIDAASALTITNAATMTLKGAPVGGGAGPVTITNPYALWVQSGNVRFDGTRMSINKALVSNVTLAIECAASGGTGIEFTRAAATGVTGFMGLSTDGMFFGATSAHECGLYTNNTKKFQITSAGLFGMNTAATTAAIAVESNGVGMTFIRAAASGVTGFVGVISSAGHFLGTSSAHSCGIMTNNSTKLLIDSAGLMAFNTTITAAAVAIESNGTGMTFIRAAASGVVGFVGVIASSGHFIGTSSAHGFGIWTTNVDRIAVSAGGDVTINEPQNDCDFRVEGDSISHLIFTDATSTTENIALLAAAAPNWQAMDRGIFVGDTSSAPTGNPASGGFLYSEGGALKWRGSGGTVTTIGPA